VSFVVAIDGPAAAGKSTTARALAAELGWRFLDTGAFYRALALKARRLRALEQPGELPALARASAIEFSGDPAAPRVTLDGEDVSEEIRGPEIGEAASRLAAIGGVREVLVRKQRSMSEHGPLVGEGRDLGTVVFPHADVKLYLDADLPTRGGRRLRELRERGLAVELSDVVRELAARDRRDETREESPLRAAPDAVVLDTTGMDLRQQVAAALDVIRAHPRFPGRSIQPGRARR